jgi:aminoglycoside phosphotransferase family enzyme
MARKQIKIPKSVVQKYLDSKEGSSVEILEYKELGSGWHGTGYSVAFKKGAKTKEVVLRTLMPVDFSHDFLSDRAKVFVLQHEMSKDIPNHIESFDVSGYTKEGDLVSLGDVQEFFQIVEVAKGSSYSDDFQRIKETGKLISDDIKKAKILSDYLVKLHSNKFSGTPEEIRSIRRRHSRDAVGHGEMMVGVIDTYPDKLSFTTKDELTGLICKASAFREKIKDAPFIPCRMHGDFHPGNVIFNGDKLILLDASRELFGDPADDVTTMAINYIWFAVMQSGSFDGPFAELFNVYWENYFNKTKDQTIDQTAGVYFAFRGVVTSHPVFYSKQSDETRKKMIRFIDNVLDDGPFNPKKINEYLR